MMERLVDQLLKLENTPPFIDRAVLSVGILSLAISLVGTVVIYT